jgi:hypothetical protein
MRNFKPFGRIAIFLVVLFAINWTLNFFIYPYSYTRIDVHNITSGQYDDLFLGSSHGKSAINPFTVDTITGRRSTNFCMGGEYPMDAYYIAKETARNHQPTRIIYELDPGYWATTTNEDTSYASVYNELPFSSVKIEYFFAKINDSDFRNTLFPWYMYRKDYKNFLENAKVKTSAAYKEYEREPFTSAYQSYQPEGFINIYHHDQPKSEDNLALWDETSLNKDSVKYFEKLVKFCADEQIELIVITTPIPTETLDKYAGEFAAANDYFTAYMAKIGVPYWNFNNIDLPGFDASIEGFSDYEGHMYGENAEIFSTILGHQLNTLTTATIG